MSPKKNATTTTTVSKSLLTASKKGCDGTPKLGEKRDRSDDAGPRPDVHPKFANRIPSPLYYSERGYIHAWYDCKQHVSIVDLATMFNISEVEVRSIITSDAVVCNEEEVGSRAERRKALKAAQLFELLKNQRA